MRGDVKELGTEPIKTPTELLEYLERKTSYNFGFGRLKSAMNSISETLSDEKITEKMVKEKLKLIPKKVYLYTD